MADESSLLINSKEDEPNESDDRDGGIRVGDIYIPPPPLPACTFDSTGPRLIITSIENINFKSYANSQELGPFHKNFTAIVGPNGSGKSNVIDAMLFVFGYRASKIRTSKVGVLIHNSDKYPNLQSCTVRVHFAMILDKGEDEYDIEKDSEFTISRTAFKDNSSTYEIDGRRVPFKEVSKLLRSYGIDLDHNRFLILQGEIEMIAMMKPKGTEHSTGMLEYLEDIIGCNRFIEPIQKLQAKIEECIEIGKEKSGRVKLAEKDMKEVETARNEAIEYMKLQNKITHMQNSVLQLQLREALYEQEQAVETRDKAKKKVDQLLLAQEELKTIRSLKEQESDITRMEYEKLTAAVEAFNEKYNALDRQDVMYRGNLSDHKARVKKMIKSLEAEEKKLEDLQKQPAIHDGEASELEKKKDILEQKKNNEEGKLKEVMATMKEETVTLQEEKDRQEAKLIDLKKVANETKSAMNIAQSELDLCVSKEKKEETKLKELEEKLEQTVNALKEKKSLHENAKTRIPEAEKKIKDLKMLLIQVTEKEKKISQEVHAKRIKVEEAKSTLSASKSRGAVLQALMQEKESGNIEGIFGRLGDLGGIDEKYDVAISTACGNLDNIVTDTISTAQKCVDFLKRNNKGYATFIALDKMTRWQPYTTQKFSAPENVKRLFDLVKVKDNRVLPAFYFALRDTLVTDDLKQGTRVGLNGRTRYRCVTLKGEVIDLAGTMSGGGGRASRGRMGQSAQSTTDTNPKEIEKMMQNLNELIKMASDLNDEKVNLENCIIQTQKELSALQCALNKNEVEFKALKESEVVLTKQIPEQRKKLTLAASDPKKVKEMQAKLQEKQKCYEKANGAATKLQDEVQSLHGQIVAITKGKFGTVQKTVNKLTKEIDIVQANITKCKAASTSAVRNQKKTEDKIEYLHREIEENRTIREKLNVEFKELEEKAKEVLDKKHAAEKDAAEWKQKSKAVHQEVTTIKDQESKLRSESIELKNDFKGKEAAVKDRNHAVKSLEFQLTKLELLEIDDDDEEEETTKPKPVLETHTEEQLVAMTLNALVYEIGSIETQMEKIKPNMASIAEYKIKADIYKKKVAELGEIEATEKTYKSHHEELRKQRLEEFMGGFKIITSKLKEVYQMITLGGDAELELVDSLDPFNEGIVFSVRPPKKSWKNITNLSGGEKTLSSLALVFALHYYKPTPFYVMDEIDAALDFKNVSIVGNYIKDRTKNAQFIIISLRNNMFELSDHLVGIYKTHNCTKSATICPREVAMKNIIAMQEAEQSQKQNDSCNKNTGQPA